MLRVQKEECVKDLEEVYKKFNSLIVVYYHGLTVSQVTDLRKSLRKGNAGFKVVKNTLAKIAFNNIELNGIQDLLSGPVAIAYANDPVFISKEITQFSNKNEALKIIGGLFDNSVVNVSDIKYISQLMSLDELRAKLIGLLQAPAIKTLQILNTPATCISKVLNSYYSNN